MSYRRNTHFCQAIANPDNIRKGTYGAKTTCGKRLIKLFDIIRNEKSSCKFIFCFF